MLCIYYSKDTINGRTLPPALKGKSMWGRRYHERVRPNRYPKKAARNHFDFYNGQKLILANDNNKGFILIPAEIFVQKV